MIFDVLFIIVGAIINSVAFVLRLLLPFSLPAAFYNSISAFFGTLGYFGGIVDLPVLYSIISYLILFEGFWVLFLIAWYTIGFFRGIVSVGGSHGH